MKFLDLRGVRNGKKGLQISERDLMILKILYRLPWAMDWHIAVLIGEAVKYVFGRLNQLARAGLVERKKLLADEEVRNYLTAEGAEYLVLKLCNLLIVIVTKKPKKEILSFLFLVVMQAPCYPAGAKGRSDIKPSGVSINI